MNLKFRDSNRAHALEVLHAQTIILWFKISKILNTKPLLPDGLPSSFTGITTPYGF